MYFNEAKFHAKPKKIEEIRRVVFREDEPSASTSCQQSETQNEVPVQAPVSREAKSIFVRHSQCILHPLDCYVPSLDYVMLTNCREPSCYKEALPMVDSKKP